MVEAIALVGLFIVLAFGVEARREREKRRLRRRELERLRRWCA